MDKYTLYGSEMSYFSGKVRAYLRWKGVAFDEVTPTSEIMKTVLLPKIGWPVIPVLTTPDGIWVQDTADIIDAVEARHPTPPVMPSGPLQTFVSLLLQLYADEWLTLPAMHYRWNHNLDWVFGEFGRNARPRGTPQEQLEAGQKAGARFRGFVPVLGISDTTIPAIEASYEALLAELATHLDHSPFMMGSAPSFADFAMMGPLYAHLYRDPASGALMRQLAPRVADWVEQVMDGKTGTPTEPAQDHIPDSLVPILARQMREQLPVLTQTAPLLTAWAQTAVPGAELPRALGTATLEIEGARAPCAARSFPLYRLQAVTTAYHSFAAEDQARIQALLVKAGGIDMLELFDLHKLTRRNYRLCLAP